MDIFLMRHGEAETIAQSDSARRLTPAGSRANRRVARALEARNAHFDLALVSPYIRARQTAEDVEAVLGGLNFRESHLVLPDSAPHELIDSLPLDGDSRVLLIGHNPLLSRLASLLTEGETSSGYPLETSELLCLRTDVAAPACASLVFSLNARTPEPNES